MKRSSIIVLLACGAVMLAGCSEKELGYDDGQTQVKDNVVSLSIGSAVTKSGAARIEERSIIADLSAESGIEGLVLEESVVSLDDLQIETKGTPVYTENFEDLYAASGFKAAAVYNSSSPVSGLAPAIFMKRDGNDHWYHEYSETVPNGLLFYFNAPATLPAYIGTPEYAPATKSLTFKLVPASYPTTATAQTDVLFTNATIDPSKVNPINFYHVFASVKFKIGNTDSGRTKITKIELSNMLTSGQCTLTVDATKKSDKNAVWSQPATASYAKFSQEYDGTTDYDAEQEFFAESFYKDNTYKNNLNKGGDKKATTTFNCVPREFAEADAKHVVATISYKIGDEAKTAEVDLTSALKGKKWEAGHLYTYTLTVTDLDVTVTDEVSGDTKSDVVITNTGNTSGYIRAAIVANWVKELGEETVIVKGVGTEEGTMTGFDVTYWIPGADGYYYYKYGVDGGKPTNVPLFESYKAAAPTIDGATLQMTIHAQIVKDRSVWGTVPTGLSNEVEK